MNSILLPDVYGADQLFTYSGLEGPTDYANMLTLLARKDRFSYSPMLPTAGGIIRLPDYGGPVTVCSDFADFGPNRMLLADAWNLLIDGTASFEDIDQAAYEINRKDGKILFAPRGYLHAEWLDADYEELHARKVRAYDILGKLPDFEGDDMARAVARAVSVLRACVYSPEDKFTGVWVTPDRWPHRHCWIMDSVYQALGLNYFDKKAACEAIMALFAYQDPTGRIPQIMGPNRHCPTTTQQPVIANGLKAIDAPRDVLAKALPGLVRYIDWLTIHRDLDDDGILEWASNAANKLNPCGESGMDNSPRFDGRSVYGAVDLTCFVSRECELIAEFAGLLGEKEIQKRFAEQHERMNRLVSEAFWDESIQFFSDFCIFEPRPLTHVAAVSGFMPLLCGAATPEQARILAAHVTNPRTFGSPYPLPSVSLADPAFEMDMWRGPVWHIFNYHTAEGLDRYGYHSEANLIRRKTVEIGLKYYKEYGAFFEFYDPAGEIPPTRINRKGPNKLDDAQWIHRAVHDYGWSASIFLDMLFKSASRR